MRFVVQVMAAAAAGALLGSAAGYAAGNLAGQQPIEVTVDLGKPGQHAFVPNSIKFETGKLYKLVLRNPSDDPHYFTSHGFSQLIYTRKVQVVQTRDGKPTTLAEFKGAIREIEVYPGPQRGMVVRAGRDRARHRSALRHHARTASRTPTSAWWARSSSSRRRGGRPLRPSGPPGEARRTRHHDGGAAHALLLHQREQRGGVRGCSRTQPCDARLPSRDT